ncbi:MAG: N-acetyltransferase [Bacteroidales bacterium]|nr:N-acetyltransferase [Bacteroidales bacterium]
MNDLIVKEVTTSKELKRFFKFPYELFKNDKMWVPSLLIDEKTTFNKKKNPSFEFCDCKIFMAFRGNKAVGRIVGIINKKANIIWKENRVRFGWFDFIDDKEVSKALLDAVIEWGKENKMKEIVGPMGFTDMDKEGMMVEGFEVDCPMSCYYNTSYYPEHMDYFSYKNEVDWIQYQIPANQPVPDKVHRINEMIRNKYSLKIVQDMKMSEIAKRYGSKLFDSINESFSHLFGYVPLNERQKQFYINQYFPFLDKRLICLIVDSNDDVVAFGVSLPSLSKALRKCKGKLFPFGWIHLLKALRNFENIDLYLNGVRPEWQNKGIHSIYYAEMNKSYIALGAKMAIANPQLETNKAANIWEKYDSRVAIRRRAYIKSI